VNAIARRSALVAAEVALVVAAVALGISGFRAVLDTTEGTAIDPELDPTSPGYEAFAEPSPAIAVLGRDGDGVLRWAAALALRSTEGGGGAVFLVPVDALVPDFAFELETVAEIDALGGADGSRQAVSDVLGLGIAEVVEVDPARVAELVRPVAPLTVTNPDGADGFPAGSLELEADDVSAFLLATEEGESDLTRMARHEAFWRSWIDAVAGSSDPDVVPGERQRGIGRFVRGLAAGAVTIDVPPVTPETTADGTVAFRVEQVATIDLMEERVPFPAGPRLRTRPHVRVLDGVGADGLAVAAARDVVLAGGQVVVVGNSDTFDRDAATRVVYLDPIMAVAATTIADDLGVVAELGGGPDPDDAVDITVVAGSDLLAAYGLVPRTTNGENPG
jgi:hypothetical protein